MATNNAANAHSTGIVRYNGTGTYDAVTTTNHNLLIGAASNGITNVAPSATSGVPIISQGASADPTFGTMVVGGGGTGGTSYTAFSVLCAGTTATGPFQNVSGLGTSGYALTSNGASALPTWQAFASGTTLQTAMVNISSTEIKALRATPKQLVAAPSAGNLIIPLQLVAKFNYGGSNVFTNGQDIELSYDNSGTYVNFLLNGVLILAADIVSTTTSYYSFDALQSSARKISGNMEARRLVARNTGGSEITGNAANNNTLTIFISYIVVPVLT